MSLQKYIFLSFYLFSIVVFSSAQSLSNENKSIADTITFDNLPPVKLSLTDSIINYGKLFLDTPYRYGASGSASFDCSGFTSYVFRNFGYNLKRSSAEQAQQFDTVNRHELKKGDLVYFAGRRRSRNVGHVGIVTEPRENGAFDFIHAAVHSGVIISKSEEKYYTDRFVKANRVIGLSPFVTVDALDEEIPANQNVELVPPMAVPVKQMKKTIPARYHRVKAGETLSEIADKYGLTVKELKKFNHLKGSKIDIKQRLKVKEQEIVMITAAVKHPVDKPELHNDSNTLKPANVVKTDPQLQIDAPRTHRVKKGESLFSISKLYGLTVDDLKKANNLASVSIKPGQDLKIYELKMLNEDIKPAAETEMVSQRVHKVKAGETLSTIAAMYNLSVNDIKRFNQLSSNSIQRNQELNIAEPAVESSRLITETAPETRRYKVKKGESLFSIAKQFDMKIEDIKASNNLSSNDISIGQVLLISHTAKNTETEQPAFVLHKVKSGDSYYSLARKYNCSVSDIKEWNHKSDNKLNIGDKLKIRAQ